MNRARLTTNVVGVAEVANARVDLGAPLVIRGGCERARGTWTDEWLVEFWGERACNVSLDSRPVLAANKASSSVRDYLERQPNGYLFQTEVDAGTTAELLLELDLPPDLRRLSATGLYRFYAGPADSGTLPHVHTHAINALVRGSKTWAIYASADETEMAAMTREAYVSYGSGSQASDWFRLECPKLRRRDIRLWEFVQTAGDIVFIPAFHLHAVINVEPVAGFTLECS